MRKVSLGEGDDQGFVEGTPGERVAMVWRLTQDAWAFSGRPIPDYSRDKMPGRIIRGSASITVSRTGHE